MSTKFNQKYKWSKTLHNLFKTLFIALPLVAIYSLALNKFTVPSNNRDWTDESKTLSTAEFATSTVKIDNIKNFEYLNGDEHQYKVNHYSDSFQYDKVKDIWLFQNDFIEPLGAHTFLTFEFEDGKYLSASAEIRKEKGESYDPYNGLFHHYEMQYVLVSEKDILTLRAGLRQPPVFMYKLKLNRNEKINLFIDVIKRANQLALSPEFYNTYDNACTSNINRHLNAMLDKDKKPGRSWKIVFPKYSDQFFYNKGLIDTGLTFSEIKQSSLVNQKVKDAMQLKLSNSDFSRFIRQSYEKTTQG